MTQQHVRNIPFAILPLSILLILAYGIGTQLRSSSPSFGLRSCNENCRRQPQEMVSDPVLYLTPISTSVGLDRTISTSASSRTQTLLPLASREPAVPSPNIRQTVTSTHIASTSSIASRSQDALQSPGPFATAVYASVTSVHAENGVFIAPSTSLTLAHNASAVSLNNVQGTSAIEKMSASITQYRGELSDRLPIAQTNPPQAPALVRSSNDARGIDVATTFSSTNHPSVSDTSAHIVVDRKTSNSQSQYQSRSPSDQQFDPRFSVIPILDTSTKVSILVASDGKIPFDHQSSTFHPSVEITALPVMIISAQTVATGDRPIIQNDPIKPGSETFTTISVVHYPSLQTFLLSDSSTSVQSAAFATAGLFTATSPQSKAAEHTVVANNTFQYSLNNRTLTSGTITTSVTKSSYGANGGNVVSKSSTETSSPSGTAKPGFGSNGKDVHESRGVVPGQRNRLGRSLRPILATGVILMLWW